MFLLLPMALFGKSICYLSMFGKMILPHLKSSIPAGFCKLNRHWSVVFLVSIIFRIRTRKCMKLFTENITECFTHAQIVCTRPLLGGRGLRMRLGSTVVKMSDIGIVRISCTRGYLNEWNAP